MEYGVVHKEFDRGKRLLIADIEALGGRVLDVINYFSNLPKSWNIHYFHSGVEFSEAMDKGDIQNDSVIVLPTDEDVVPGRIYTLTISQGIKVLVVLGQRNRKLIDDRDLWFYIDAV